MNCELCKDTGTIETHTKHELGETRSASLCQCRRNLPPRAGKVFTWMHGESTYEEIEVSGVEWMTFGIRYTPEVPVSEDGYPLIRTADNAHWCGRIQFELDPDWPALNPDGLREIAAFILKMADKIDEWDKPVPEVAS